jgi:hypothetical protein
MIDNYEYLGVGIVNKGPFKTAFPGWIETVFKDYIQRKDGTPRVKVHGFAANALDILKQYPFYSCDASTWSFGARLGHVQIPDFIVKNNRVTDYDYFPHRIKSIPLTPRRESDSSHYRRLNVREREMLDDYFEMCGADVTLLRDGAKLGYFERDYANAFFFINAEKALKRHYADNFNFGQGGNIYLAGTASSSSNTIPGVYALVRRIFERENTLKFLLSYWYEQYANTNIVLHDYLNLGNLNADHVQEMMEVKKDLKVRCDSSKSLFERNLRNFTHLEDLTLAELESSISTASAFKKNKEEPANNILNVFEPKKKEPIAFFKRAVPQPKVEVEEVTLEEALEAEQPEMEEVVQEYLDAMTENVSEDQEQDQDVLMSITPLIRLNMNLRLPKDTSISAINDLVNSALSSALGTINYELISISIEEKMSNDK